MINDNNTGRTLIELLAEAQENGLSISQLVNNAKKDKIGFANTIISEEEMVIRDLYLKGDFYKFTKLSENEAYFWDKNKNKYVIFDSSNFYSTFTGDDANITPKVIKGWFNLIDFYKHSVKVDKDSSYYLHNSMNFNNGSFILNKTTKVMEFTSVEDIKPSTYFVDYEIDLSVDSLSDKMEDYLFKIGNSNEEDFKFLLDMLASIYLPSELVEQVYWIYGIGGKGKSDFIRTIIKSLVGDDNTSNVKIDFFDERKNNKEFRLGDLAGKLVNIDDDYSGHKLVNTGTIKQVSSGKNDFQADIKGEKPITFKVNAKLFINTNKKPLFSNFDTGDARRNVIYHYKADFDKWSKENGRPYDFSFLKDKNEMEMLASFLVNRAIEMSKSKTKNKEDYKHFVKTDSIKKAEAYLRTDIDYLKKYFKSSIFRNEDRYSVFIEESLNNDGTKTQWFLSTTDLLKRFNQYLNKIEDRDDISAQKINILIKEMGLIQDEDKVRKSFSVNVVNPITDEVKVESRRLFVYKVHHKLAKTLSKVKK